MDSYHILHEIIGSVELELWLRKIASSSGRTWARRIWVQGVGSNVRV